MLTFFPSSLGENDSLGDSLRGFEVSSTLNAVTLQNIIDIKQTERAASVAGSDAGVTPAGP